MIINPLPNFPNIAKVKINPGLLKVNKNTKGKQLIKRNAPII